MYVQKHSQLRNAPNLTPNSQHVSEGSSYVTRSYVAGSLSSLPPTVKEESNSETIPMRQEQTTQHNFQCSHSNVKVEPYNGADEVRHQNYPV